MSITNLFALLGGVGLFLYGMTVMSSGLRNACGEKLGEILEKATRNRWISVLAGTGVTVLIQSSSATDIMVIGFVTSGLMNLLQALYVIMGANIGTTITAQITAFDIGTYAPLILFTGAIVRIFVKDRTMKEIGNVILGFGMLFEGIVLMKSAIAPLAAHPDFIRLVSGISNPVLLIILGVLFTAILQSSSSSIVIFQAFAVEGIITYTTAVYLAIGAAVGSVTPNLLAGLTANRNGKRCAILNLLFNLVRVCLITLLITLIPQILLFIQGLSPDSVARQIANTHTIFAILSVLILMPAAPWLVKLSERIIPVTAEESRKLADRKLIYLTQADRIPAALAIEQAHREIARMAKISIENLILSTDCFLTQDESKRERVEETEETVDYLAHEIVEKLVEIRGLNLSLRNMNRLYRMIRVVDDIERISDHAENIVEYEQMVEEGRAKLSEEAFEDLRTLSAATAQSLRFALSVFENEEFALIPEAKDLEEIVDDVKDEIEEKHLTRLLGEGCEPHGAVIFTDMAIDLERCSDHAYNMATALWDENEKAG